jgi:membrane-associated HD superfamily phosphohydrolase
VTFGKDNEMRITYTIILLLIMTAVPVYAAEKAGQEPQDDIWTDSEQAPGQRQQEMPPEMIDQILRRLQQNDPEKAKQLKKLAEENPQQFRAELRKQFQGRRGQRGQGGPGGQRGQRSPGFGRRGGPDMPPPERPGQGPMGPGPMGSGGMGRERMRTRYLEYTGWLSENYPKQAKKLEQLKTKNPELYARQVALGYRKHSSIIEASQGNPQLAEILKNDLTLKQKRDKLLRKIAGSADQKERKQLTAELEEIVSSRFDLIVKRKQNAYEQLRKELEKLQEKVKKSEAEVGKWKEIKDEKVKQRLEELISQTEKFSWD